MAKKRRHAPASAASAAARNGPLSALGRGGASADPTATRALLARLNGHYGKLHAEVASVPATLDRALALHSLLTIALQNALMYDEELSTLQIALAVGTAVWTIRGFVVASCVSHDLSPGLHEKRVLWRVVVACVVLSALLLLLYERQQLLSAQPSLLVLLLFLLDAASLRLSWTTRGRLTRREIALSTIEVTFLAVGFSTQLNFKPGLIYDRLACLLSGVTTAVHTLVLLSTKYVVTRCLDAGMKTEFARTQQRSVVLMQRLWQDIDQDDPEQLLAASAATSKKKRKAHKNKLGGGAAKRASAARDANPLSAEAATLPSEASVSAFSSPRVQLAALTLVQTLLLLSQLLLSAFVLHAWEATSVLLLSSSHVLWTLGQTRRKALLATPAERVKLKSE